MTTTLILILALAVVQGAVTYLLDRQRRLDHAIEIERIMDLGRGRTGDFRDRCEYAEKSRDRLIDQIANKLGMSAQPAATNLVPYRRVGNEIHFEDGRKTDLDGKDLKGPDPENLPLLDVDPMREMQSMQSDSSDFDLFPPPSAR